MTTSVLAAGLIYFILLGGTTVGEVIPALQLMDAVLGGIFIGLLLLRMPSDWDTVDATALIAVLFFLGSAVLARLPRQALPEGLASFAFVGLLYWGRRSFADQKRWQGYLLALRLMAFVFVPFIALVWGSTLWAWVQAVRFQAPPPLNLELRGVIWGHRHDVALLAVVLTASFWDGRLSSFERLVRWPITAIAVGLVFVDGSRNLWFAIAIATGTILWLRRGASIVAAGRAQVRDHWRIAVGAGFLLGCIGLLLGSAVLRRLAFLPTLDARAGLWSASVEAWTLNPVAGLGPGSFSWDLQLTSYFQASSWAPRHPDSAFFQLLAETGLLGCAAVLALGAGVIMNIRRRRPDHTPLWVVLVVLVACLGANPTSFSFLVALLVLWAARCLPPDAAREIAPRRASRLYRLLAPTLLATIGLAFISMTVAAFAYQAASDHISTGNLRLARGELSQAIALDPGMALYVRDRGTLSLVSGNPSVALPDLLDASEMNPSDVVARRSLALAYEQSGDLASALAAAQGAVDKKASAYTSLVLLASLQVKSGLQSAALDSLARAADVAPWAAASDSFRLGDVSSQQVLQLAVREWERGGSPAPAGPQAVWLVALAGTDGSLAQAIASYPQATAAMTSIVETMRGRIEQARYHLRAAFGAEYDQSWYWAARYLVAVRTNQPDPQASAVLRLVWPGLLSPRPNVPILEDTVASGLSEDQWGYQRVAAPLAALGPELPSPDAALLTTFHSAAR